MDTFAYPSVARPHRTREGPRVESRRPEPQEPCAHRPHHDRRRGLRGARPHEPEAGAHPLDRVPAARRRLDLSGCLARSCEQRRLDPDRVRHPGRPRSRGDVGDQYDERVDHPGVLHVRHEPGDRRAEDHTGDQPHQESAARGRRPERHLGQHRRLPGDPARGHRLRRRAGHSSAARIHRRPRTRGRRRGQRRADRGRGGAAHHDHARSGRPRGRGLLAAGDPRRPRAERRAVPRWRDHRGRPDPHRADRREDRLGRRDRRPAARAVGCRPVRLRCRDDRRRRCCRADHRSRHDDLPRRR